MPSVGRRCGACTLCCTVLRVDELAKPARQACAEMRSGSDGPGCRIYERRPAICRAYECAWLLGSFGEHDRPDRLGAVLDLVFRGDRLWLEIHEESAGAFERSERLREIAEEYRTVAHVRISDCDRAVHPERPFRILLPGGVEQRVRGSQIQVYRDGVPVGSSEIGPLRRAVTRVLRAWRLRRTPTALRGRR